VGVGSGAVVIALVDQPVWAGADKDSTKMWPMDKMKLGYTADYIAP
jgi:hypothetical protein